MENFRTFFEQNYQGTEAFISEIISPVFGTSCIKAEEKILETHKELKPAAERANIISIQRFGSCDLDVPMDFFDITLNDHVHLSQSRVYIQQLVRQIMQTYSAALIVFHYTDNELEWRVSYVSKGSNAADATSAKRYTYLMGRNQKCRTAAERFANLAIREKTEANITEAFSVEKVSKEFFDEYKKQYDIFCNYMLSKPGIRQTIFNGDEKAIRDFNKKLLGRIVFLYFIQKKGWLGVPVECNWGEGDFDFLTKHFNQFRNPDLFYPEFLCPLFFETLNKDRKLNNDLVEFIAEPCRIPYLNGGLFEEQDKKYRNLIFPAQLFKDLFNFFNQYNFTIYEDDPNDHTVAVDPEMLGHIFENLLEDNKDKGAFYTPKEIVHYMCQESLIEYLCTTLQIKDEAKEREAITALLKTKEIDEVLKTEITNINKALDNVKICDPAIGSGAFPMGLLHEIYTAKQTLWHFEHGNLADFPASAVKLNIIQNSIYGVDIEKGAVDIARLRFWLSLIVDEPKPEALPNLDYKIVVGNSLVSKLEDDIIDIDWTLNETSQGFFGVDLAKQKYELLKKISKEQKDFFNPAIDKKKIATDIRNLKIDLLINQLQLMVTTNGIETKPSGTGKVIAKQTERYLQTLGWKESIKQLTKLKTKPDEPLHFFDWKLDFPEVMNGQIAEKVGFDIVIGNPPYVVPKNMNDSEKNFYETKFKSAVYQVNLYLLFIDKSIELLKKNGVCSLIVPNTWLINKTVSPFRMYLMENFNIQKIADLTKEEVFNATVLPIVFNIKKERVINSNILIYEFVEKKVFKKMQLKYENILNDKNCLINYQMDSNNISIINKIENNAIVLSEIADCSFGVKFYQVNKGKPKQTKNIVENHSFSHNKRINKYCKMILEGKDVDRYSHSFNGKWIEYGEWLAEPRKQTLFEGERILLRRIVGKGYLIGQYIDGEYCNNSLLHTIKLKSKKYDTKYVLGILNSKLIGWFFIQKYARDEKVFPEIRIHELEMLPIKQFSKQSILSKIVNKVLSLKSEGKDTTSLEQEIDNLVYKLYELTYEEVKVIDSEFELTVEEYNRIEIE